MLGYEAAGELGVERMPAAGRAGMHDGAVAWRAAALL